MPARKGTSLKTPFWESAAPPFNPAAGYAPVQQRMKIQKHLMEALIAAGGHPSILFHELKTMFLGLEKRMPAGRARSEAANARVSASVAADSFIKRWQGRIRRIKSAGVENLPRAIETEHRIHSIMVRDH